MGRARLRVADGDRAQSFYDRAIGLRTLDRSGDGVVLGAEGGPAAVALAVDPDAPPRPPGTTGLFHLAILVPSRVDLARALRRVVEAGWRVPRAAGHLVSGALYLNDREGTAIGIYRARPRDEWRYADGQLQRAPLPLDIDSLLADLEGSAPADTGMPAGTRIGHTHLNVSDIAASEDFYVRG